MCVPPSIVITFSLRFSKATLPRPQQRMIEAIRWPSSTSCTTPVQVRPFSSICTLSYVNKSVIPPPVHGQPGHIHFSYLFSSRTSIHQSVLLNPLSSAFSVGSFLSITSHVHVFSIVEIFFQSPLPCSTIITSDHHFPQARHFIREFSILGNRTHSSN